MTAELSFMESDLNLVDWQVLDMMHVFPPETEESNTIKNENTINMFTLASQPH